MRKILPLLIILFSLSLNSCYVNRTTVADGPVGKSGVRYSHTKQMYLFWGLLPIGQAQPRAPQGCGYQVKTAFNFVDILINGITGGIFGTRNIKILVNKGGPCDPAILKIERKENKEIRELEKRDHRGN